MDKGTIDSYYLLLEKGKFKEAKQMMMEINNEILLILLKSEFYRYKTDYKTSSQLLKSTIDKINDPYLHCIYNVFMVLIEIEKGNFDLESMISRIEPSIHSNKLDGILGDLRFWINLVKANFHLNSGNLDDSKINAEQAGRYSSNFLGKCKLGYLQGEISRNQGNTEEALRQFKETIALLEDKKTIVLKTQCANRIAAVYWMKGNLEESLEILTEEVDIWAELKRKKDLAAVLNNIGIIHQHKQNYNTALDYYNQALHLRLELGAKNGIANSFYNIAIIYYLKGDVNMSLDYELKALDIWEEINDVLYQALALHGIGNKYFIKGEFDKSLNYYEVALELDKKIGNKQEIAKSLNSIGLVYYQQKKYDLAEMNYLKSLKLKEDIGNEYELSSLLYAIIQLYIDLDEIDEAKSYLDRIGIIKQRNVDNRHITHHFWLSKAKYYQAQNRAKDKFIAMNYYEKVVNDDIIQHDLTITALVNLNKLILLELEIVDNQELLRTYKNYTKYLFQIAKKQNLPWVEVETLLLDVQYEILCLNIDSAYKKLEQASQIVTENKLYHLMDEISLLKQEFNTNLEKWKCLVLEENQVFERIKIQNFKEYLNKVFDKY